MNLSMALRLFIFPNNQKDMAERRKEKTRKQFFTPQIADQKIWIFGKKLNSVIPKYYFKYSWLWNNAQCQNFTKATKLKSAVFWCNQLVGKLETNCLKCKGLLMVHFKGKYAKYNI